MQHWFAKFLGFARASFNLKAVDVEIVAGVVTAAGVVHAVIVAVVDADDLSLNSQIFSDR